MAVKAELEELVKWISDLQKKAETDEPKTEPLPRKDWYAIADNLKDVAEKLGEARSRLAANFPDSVLKELASDLQRDAEALDLRARLLARRAEAKDGDDGTTKHCAATAIAHRAAAAKEKESAKEAEARKREKEERDRLARPSDLVYSAAGTIEAAHRHLGNLEQRDAVAKAFEEELDVLAEMTLSLRQKCRELDGGVTPRPARNKPPAARPKKPPGASGSKGQSATASQADAGAGSAGNRTSGEPSEREGEG